MGHRHPREFAGEFPAARLTALAALLFASLGTLFHGGTPASAAVAVALAGLAFGVALAPTPAQRRSAAGRCRRCGYDLTGNESGVCPECGTAIGPPAPAPDYLK